MKLSLVNSHATLVLEDMRVEEILIQTLHKLLLVNSHHLHEANL